MKKLFIIYNDIQMTSLHLGQVIVETEKSSGEKLPELRRIENLLQQAQSLLLHEIDLRRDHV